jgi:hypothetical protein
MTAPEDMSLDPEAAKRVREAFEMACARLPRNKRDAESRDLLAAAVFQIATEGETDPRRLSVKALMTLGWIA